MFSIVPLNFDHFELIRNARSGKSHDSLPDIRKMCFRCLPRYTGRAVRRGEINLFLLLVDYDSFDYEHSASTGVKLTAFTLLSQSETTSKSTTIPTTSCQRSITSG